ncbi:MAG: hypothetical protein ACXVCX_17130, partial [Ktedonobacterales bacterium]
MTIARSCRPTPYPFKRIWLPYRPPSQPPRQQFRQQIGKTSNAFCSPPLRNSRAYISNRHRLGNVSGKNGNAPARIPATSPATEHCLIPTCAGRFCGAKRIQARFQPPTLAP